MSYNPIMAKPKSSNRSIRLTDDLWGWLNAESERQKTSVNGLVGHLLFAARHQSVAAKVAAQHEAAVKAATIQKYQPSQSISSLGSLRRPVGSLLKGAKKS